MVAELDLSGPLQRRNYGRNHGYQFGDVKVPGVTTIIGVLDKPALTGWAAGEAAEVVGNATRKDGHLLVVDVEEMWDDLRSKDDRMPPEPTRTKLVEGLKWRHRKSRDELANRGTEVHRIAEQLTRGREVDVPEALTGHVDAYIDWWTTWAPIDPMVELSVGSRRYGGWGGTLDMICTLPGLGRALVDIKTNRSGPFGEVALQLAGYRYAEVYLDDDGVEQPMPEVDWCGVLWLRADGWDLFPYVADREVFRHFLYCRGVYGFVKEPKEGELDAGRLWSRSVKGDALRLEDVAP